MAIKLGDIVRDSISGYEGVAIGVTQWIYGCRRIMIQAKGLHEGKPLEPVCIDEPQCTLVAVGEDIELAMTGGPHPTPTRRKAVTRR